MTDENSSGRATATATINASAQANSAGAASALGNLGRRIVNTKELLVVYS